MDRVLVILIGWPIAFLILRFRRIIKEFIGNVAFAERFLGSGGTNTLIVILGGVVFVGCLMYATGTLQSILQNIIGPFF